MKQTNEKNTSLSIKGVHEMFLIRDGKIIKSEKLTNLVTHIGLQTMFQKMTNEYAGDLKLNKAALGTGVTSPAITDTKLQTETYRNNVISSTAENNVLYLDAFFTKEEVDGTFKEFGYFIDGEAGANTGYLFNRLSVDWVKTNLDSLFVRSTFTITNI